ncbi:MAG: Gfo/Idh/MocA family oxidoreductase [Planctomycetaceae bacterium]|nr:Gfo/Idh/MocA family oxidoreductase [Planctomycetaceae bacterium]
MKLTPEQIQIGKDNFHEAVGYTRRDFFKGAAAATTGLGAMYFGYENLEGEPVRVGFIGTGDEGNILLNEHPPEYMNIVAVADLREPNLERAFQGDGNDVRQGLIRKLGEEKAKTIKRFKTHKDLIAAKDELGLEAVVIAVPLSQHAPIAMDALDAGLHVLTEKLMAHNITECKNMIRKATEKKRLLAVGHQRHYSVLYDNANELVKTGVLGDIKYIRAQWHRNNSFPLSDSWRKPLIKEDNDTLKSILAENGVDVSGLKKTEDIRAKYVEMMDEKAKEFGYEDFDQLVNWRLFNETGGGLMAELGSHQMDAASIFLGKVHPLAVSGFGGKNFYGIPGVGPKDKWDDDREIDDQIFVTFEFPGKTYDPSDDAHSRDKCVVTYSSINTNKSEPYGELVYGTRGTLWMKTEKEALLYKEEGRGSTGGGPDQRLWVVNTEGASAAPVLDAYETTAPSAAATEASSSMGEKISRGYTEEMEHFCYCIRNNSPMEELRCNGVVAMADAIMALTANLAMKHNRRIEFKDKWFDPNSEAVPEEDIEKLVKQFPQGGWDDLT